MLERLERRGKQDRQKQEGQSRFILSAGAQGQAELALAAAVEGDSLQP